jgi:hypothetical protein
MANEKRQSLLNYKNGASGSKDSLSVFSDEVDRLKILAAQLQTANKTIFLIHSDKLEKWLRENKNEKLSMTAQKLRKASEISFSEEIADLEKFIAKTQANKKTIRSVKRWILSLNEQMIMMAEMLAKIVSEMEKSR